MAHDASEAFDLSKENVQPLRQGRNVARLETALQAQNNAEIQYQLQKEKEKHELLIREYEGDDPLQPHCDYVAWLEQSYPKQGPESNLISLLEDTLTKFKDCIKYKQDPRYVQLLIKYINTQPKPLELYNLVYSQGIGTLCSSLYMAWAEELEKNEDYKRAYKVYDMGVAAHAEPNNDLMEAQVHFQLRAVRIMFNDKSDVSSEEVQIGKRIALTKLKPSAVSTSRAKCGFAGTFQPITTPKHSSGNGAAFSVYREDEENSGMFGAGSKGGSLNKLQKASITEKENMKKAGKWCGQKQKQLAAYKPSVPTTPSFQVHVDPMAAYDGRKEIKTLHALKTKKEHVIPVAVFEPPDPTRKPMYAKHLIYVGGSEFQFEELRAVAYTKMAAQRAAEKSKSIMMIDRDELETSPMKRRKVGNNSTGEQTPSINECVTSDNQIRDTHSSEKAYDGILEGGYSISTSPSSTSMTVNTKAAMNVVQQMWASPSPRSDKKFKKLANDNDTFDECSFKIPVPPKPKQTTPAFSVFVEDDVQPMPKINVGVVKPLFNVYQEDKKEKEESENNLDERYKKEKKKTMFQVYSDSEEQQPVANNIITVTANKSPDMKKQNVYKQQYGKTAVLENKENITRNLVDIPLLQDDSDDEFIQNDVPETDFDEVTCNTKAFAFILPSSTPSSKQSRSIYASRRSTMINRTSNEEPLHVEQETKIQKEKQEGANLSMILEASKERYSSSSGSSGSSAGGCTTSKFSLSERRSLAAIKEQLYEESEVELSGFSKLNLEENIDPFDENLIDKLLLHMNFPQSQHNCGYYSMNSDIPVMRQNTCVKLGQEKWVIANEIGKGAYARILRANPISQSNNVVALKVQKPAALWEWYIAREIQTRLKNDEQKRLFLNMKEAYIFDNGSVLISDWAQYGSLLDLLNKFKTTGKQLGMGVCMNFSIQLISALNYLHSCYIIHGDVKPDNFVIRILPNAEECCIQLIDFGRSIDMTLFPPNTTFNAVVTTDCFQCHEMRDNKPWTYQADIYGLAGTMYILLMGDYMKTVKSNDQWVLSKPLPRYMKKDLWDPIFNCLLNIESCNELPDLTAIRWQLHSSLASVNKYDLNQQFAAIVNVLCKY